MCAGLPRGDAAAREEHHCRYELCWPGGTTPPEPPAWPLVLLWFSPSAWFSPLACF